MQRRTLILLTAFLLCLLGHGLIVARKNNAPAPTKPAVATSAPEPVDEEAMLRARAEEERQLEAQLKGLANLEARQNLRNKAARHMYEARSRWQFIRSAAWSSVLTTNRLAFEALRHQAEDSPTRSTPCTICDSRGTLAYCVLCENAGKCPSCRGSGKGFHDETCPTCMGDGKCYLCFGSGKMLCLYCDDGTLSLKGPLPAMALPLRCDPVPAEPTVVADLQDAQAEAGEDAQESALAPPLPTSHILNALLLVGALLLGAALALQEGARQLNKRYNPWAPTAAAVERALSEFQEEEEAFSKFVEAFKTGSTAPPGGSPFAATPVAESAPVKMFFAKAPEWLGKSRKLLQEISTATDDAVRRTAIADLQRELGALKGAAGLPQVLPVWQMASALEGLAKQLANKAGDVTQSTLRTVATGVDCLNALCVPGLRADLLTCPPLRLLAVDDDLISRQAISLALKKAHNLPDLAVDGNTALALATQQTYDVIFLDVQMPGMDGFELCKKIHETAPNAGTPVVFVTNKSDFEARAQSTLSGGCDLIGKPYLTFEITVKALTLAVKGRLRGRAQPAGAHTMVNGSKASSPAKAKIIPVQNPLPHTSNGAATARLPMMLKGGDRKGPSPVGKDGLKLTAPGADESSPPSELLPDEQAFLTRASAHLGPLRDLIQGSFQTKDEAARQGKLADFYLQLSSFLPQVDTRHPALQMCVALEGLLKKLLEDPKHGTSSTLLTVATAVDLLIDLCGSGAKPGLTHGTPIRTLAVDDDPIARRAITCALQMVFEKPESADTGAAALALATEKPFDVIFLDVQMPGMDGFTTCLRIRETIHNRTTPVVFVTSNCDFKARSQSTVSGGSDLIAKPFLNAEIKVKALTYALRGRLQSLKTAERLMQFEGKSRPTRSDLVPVLA